MINFAKIPNTAYRTCFDNKDSNAYKFITDTHCAYLYCEYVKDRPEIRKLITGSYRAYQYCRWVKDRPEIRKLITNPIYLQLYKEWKMLC